MKLSRIDGSKVDRIYVRGTRSLDVFTKTQRGTTLIGFQTLIDACFGKHDTLSFVKEEETIEDGDRTRGAFRRTGSPKPGPHNCRGQIWPPPEVCWKVASSKAAAYNVYKHRRE